MVKTWPMYFVNGYKFHTQSWNDGKKTFNCGICVKGTGNVNSSEDDFYGILKEIIQLEYPGRHNKKLTLFSCDWFDPVMNRGMRVHPLYGIVEIKHNRRYASYDPFIFAQQATQVYYTPYPRHVREKLSWWVVIKTKPRHVIDHSHQLEVAYQDDEMSKANEIIDNNQIDTLRDIDGNLEEIELYVDFTGQFVTTEEDIGDENEYDDDEEEEDDDNEEEDEDDDDEDVDEDDDNEDVDEGDEHTNEDESNENEDDEDEDDA